MKDPLLQSIEETDVFFVREMPHFIGSNNKDYVFPHIILTLILSGSAKAMFDMRLKTYQKNDLAIILPGHILHPIESSDDFSYALLFISPKMLDDLRFQTFSHDYEKFNYDPSCSLTDEQAAHLLAIVEQLAIIANHTDKELPHRYQALLAQLSVGYEFLNYYRREQDGLLEQHQNTEIFNRFADLVVKHYRESREVQFYADRLNITAKHLSKVIHTVTNNLSPIKWIEQYVTAQAKHLIEARTTLTFQEIAYMLGFSEATSFYRFFKRTTGMTAKQYRDSRLKPTR